MLASRELFAFYRVYDILSNILGLLREYWRIYKIMRKIADLVRYSIRNFIIFPVVARAKFIRIQGHKYRSLRVVLLKSWAKKLHDVMKRCEFRQDILVKGDGDICIISDGVILDCDGSNRYFKVSGKSSGNEGVDMLSFLKAKGMTEIKSMIDIGTNVGEISLYFSKEFPSARIVSIEPSPRNLHFLRKNIAAQYFNTKNIAIFECALSDKDGEAFLSDSKAQSSIVVTNNSKNGYEVRTIRLSTLWAEAGLGDVDFVKIDIEGAEPLLLRDLEEYASRAGAWLIEFGGKNSPDAYVAFFSLFERKGYRIYSRAGEMFASAKDAESYFRQHKEGDDFWFVSPQYLN
ncbi:MAG: FkbM family methyltransferase [Dechloromonas sp.]|nr:MAG: FkbM family methyltransferase [Dechloromonas sp.]